jgi:hypothetical protein
MSVHFLFDTLYASGDTKVFIFEKFNPFVVSQRMADNFEYFHRKDVMSLQ